MEKERKRVKSEQHLQFQEAIQAEEQVSRQISKQ